MMVYPLWVATACLVVCGVVSGSFDSLAAANCLPKERSAVEKHVGGPHG